MKRRSHKRAVGLIMVTAVVLLVGLAGCGAKDATATNVSQPTQTQTVAAKSGSVSVVVEAPAVVEPYLTQTIRAQVEGIVVSAVREGQDVRSGEVLVRLDQGDQQAAVRQADLSLSQSKINRQKAADEVTSAERDLKDKETLLKSGAIPQDQVRTAADALAAARRSLDSATISVSQGQLALERAQGDLAATVVRAPFDGVVIKANLNPGDLVNKGGELLTLADISRLRLSAEVDEYDIGKVEPGQAVTITSDTLGKTSLQTKVERVSKAAEIVNNIPIFKVYSVLQNSDEKLKPGMSTDISILIRSDRGLVVPSSAVSSVRSRSYVKVEVDGKVETKRVEVGADNGTNVVVLSGIEEGDQIVVPTAGGINLGATQGSTGTSVVPINIPGTGGTK